MSGGAINGQGIGTLIVDGSTFTGNVGSNGGAIGTQDENVTVVNSTFAGNRATGTGGNPGNGGDGGAMSYDGAMVSWTMCGDTFTKNRANASGGAIFRVATTTRRSPSIAATSTATRSTPTATPGASTSSMRPSR